MQIISASEIKQNSTLLQNALREDLLITKRNKPFVVVMDYKKYQEFINTSKKPNQKDWMDETFGVLDKKDSDALLETIYSARVDKDVDA
jgi:prevent-host-death family protein